MGSNNVSAYQIDGLTGGLTELPFSPIALGSGTWSCLGINPTGSILIVGDSGGKVASFSITDSDAIAAPGSPYSTISPDGTRRALPFSCAFSHDGKYFYAGGDELPFLAGFNVDQSTGALTPLDGSPFDTGAPNPSAYAADTQGRLFVANVFNGQLRVFTIADGIPAAAQGNPFSSGLVQAVHGVVHRAGFYMVADRNGHSGPTPDQVGVYRVSGSGADTTLLAVDDSPYPAGDFTNVLALNGAERFLFASNGQSRNITTFAVESTSTRC